MGYMNLLWYEFLVYTAKVCQFYDNFMLYVKETLKNNWKLD